MSKKSWVPLPRTISSVIYEMGKYIDTSIEYASTAKKEAYDYYSKMSTEKLLLCDIAYKDEVASKYIVHTSLVKKHEKLLEFMTIAGYPTDIPLYFMLLPIDDSKMEDALFKLGAVMYFERQFQNNA